MFGRSLTGRLVAVIAVVTTVCVLMVVVAVTWASHLTTSTAVTGRTALAAVMFGFTAVVLAALVAWRLGRQLSKPVVVMAQTMRRMAEGDLDVVAPPTHAPTELGDMAEALEAFRTNARERLEAEAGRRAAEKTAQDRSDFLAVMSHEIRTPMNGVLGMADALGRTALTQDQRQMLTLLTQSGDILLGLLNNVLDYSKIESGRLELQRAPLDLRGVVETAVAAFATEANRKGVRLSVHAPEVLPQLMGDASRIGQVLQNLLSNAVKFTDAGAVAITVTVQPGVDSRCEVRISVQDTGVGIPPELQTRLFQKFVQGDASSTRAHDGAGLGLAISRELARLMGGDLTVVSQEGEGSTFTLVVAAELAAETPPEVGSLPFTMPYVQAARPLRVLAVDDNASNRQVIGILLEMMGARTTFAFDGAEALERWSHDVFDLILLDVEMPVMDGLTATRAIRAREGAEGRTPVRIIAVGDGSETQEMEACLAAGMNAHVSKPVRPSTLFGAIDQVLNGPEATGARQAA
ncbi:MAG: response regulator [Proteobacteria bacterium]|nr:response regulator [Pseudomonadota bacterium]